jgi:hypothetical protein
MAISFEEIENFATQKVNHLLDLIIFEITEDIYFFDHSKIIGAIDHLKDIIGSSSLADNISNLQIKKEIKKPATNLLLSLQFILDNVEEKDKSKTNKLLKNVLIKCLDKIKATIIEEKEDIKYLLTLSHARRKFYIECVLVFHKLEESRELDDFDRLLKAHIDRKFNISIDQINRKIDKTRAEQKDLKKTLQEKKYFLKQVKQLDPTQNCQIEQDILKITEKIKSLTTKLENIHELYKEQYAYQQNLLNKKINQLERKEIARYNLLLALQDTKTLPTKKSVLIKDYKEKHNSFRAQYIDTCQLARERLLTYQQAWIFSLSDLMAYNEAFIYNKTAINTLFSMVKPLSSKEVQGLQELASIDFIKINYFLENNLLLSKLENGQVTLKQIADFPYEDLPLLHSAANIFKDAFNTIWPCPIPTLKYLLSYPTNLIITVLRLGVHTDLRMDNAGISIADNLVLQIEFIKNINLSNLGEKTLQHINKTVLSYCVTELLSINHPNFLPCLKQGVSLGNETNELLENAVRENLPEVAEILLTKSSEQINLTAKKMALELAKKKGCSEIEPLLTNSINSNTYAAVLKRNLDTRDFSSKELEKKKMSKVSDSCMSLKL